MVNLCHHALNVLARHVTIRQYRTKEANGRLYLPHSRCRNMKPPKP